MNSNMSQSIFHQFLTEYMDTLSFSKKGECFMMTLHCSHQIGTASMGAQQTYVFPCSPQLSTEINYRRDSTQRIHLKISLLQFFIKPLGSTVKSNIT